MANVLSKGTLFPPELTNEMFNLVRGKSSLARLSGGRPIPFNGEQMFTFNFDHEISIVAENGAKVNGGATIAPVNVVPVKVEYGTRLSDEFVIASDELRLQYLRAFSEGFAAKVARGLDLMAFHGINPYSGSASAVIGNNHFDYAVSNTVTFDPTYANDNVEAAIGLVQGAEHEVTGMAMAPAFRSALSKLKTSGGAPLFPNLGWGATPGEINGLAVDSNSTVSYGGSRDRAIVGNFRDFFRWGYARNVQIKLIEYGNPDNDAEAGDLQGHNQVYLRGEAYIGWGILLPAAFARIIGTSVTLNKTTATVAASATTSLTATTNPSGGSVTWASSDTSVATVSNGTVTGVAAGTATITATSGDGSAQCVVTVTAS